jgi:hypothetical protein
MLFSNNIIENFQYESSDDFKNTVKNKNSICIKKYYIYTIYIILCFYAAYLSYVCNSIGNTIIFGKVMPNWGMGIIGFILGIFYLLYYIVKYSILKKTCEMPTIDSNIT